MNTINNLSNFNFSVIVVLIDFSIILQQAKKNLCRQLNMSLKPKDLSSNTGISSMIKVMYMVLFSQKTQVKLK